MGDAVVTVIGLVGGECFGRPARRALADARFVVGASRHLDAVALPAPVERLELRGPLDDVLDAIEARVAAGTPVCVLASGDPGFFGIVRVLVERLGTERLVVHPAPSSVALAFARAGTSWDDATVVSAHGRPLADAVGTLTAAPKAAVLTSPDHPPELVGKALLEAGCGPRQVTVCSRLGEEDEAVEVTDLAGLAGGAFDPLSVVVLTVAAADGGPGLAWGLAEAAFRHRDGMITKAEVRAVALGKLALPPAGVLWDVGAGSGSVAVECARLRPGLRVFAIERVAEDAERIRANAAVHNVEVEVVHGEAPAALAPLADPDRVFVGGGGPSVLDAVLARLRPGGVVVANYALVDRAAAAFATLGNLVQVGVARGTAAAGGVRLAAENPVFVCWGGRTVTDGAGDVVLGVGASSRGTGEEIGALVDATLGAAGLARAQVRCVATVDARREDPRLVALGWPVVGFAAAELDAVAVALPSEAARRALGTGSVAEAAALLGAGPGAELVGGRRRSAHATVAVARQAGPRS